jgi:AraC family transcriptional regulator, arabinose operon regulatory protein
LRELEPFEDIDHPRVSVLPRPLVAEALRKPVTRRLLVTDVGWFERAGHHVIRRANGSDQSIVILCVEGSGWVELNGARHGIGAGTVALIPSGHPHAYGSSASQPWTIWWAHLQGSDVPELIAVTGATISRPLVHLGSPERCVALVDEILIGLTRDQSPMRQVAASGTAYKLITQIASDRLTSDRDDPLQRALAYLTDRLDSTVRVGELARLVGVSETRLGVLFREATGGGVLAHHTALKMSRARQLLDAGRMSIGEIAQHVGYEDQLYFSRVFRKTHGVSPSEYRSHRKG